MFRHCAFVTLLVLTGCTLSSTYDEQVSRVGPEGIRATITTEDHGEFSGEVLGVQPFALILRATAAEQYDGPVIVQIAYPAIRQGRFQRAAALNVSSSYWTPSKQWRHNLRLRSRFPQGITPDVMDRLLRLHNQNALITVP